MDFRGPLTRVGRVPAVGETFEVDTASGAVRQSYAASGERRLAALDHALTESGVDTLRLGTGADFGPRLQHFFERRRRR